MLRAFTKYASIGVINTLVHWSCFYLLYLLWDRQSLANFLAFCVAVTFSFYANARWTFNKEATTSRYFLYVGFMGLVALSSGYLADRLNASPLITLVSFSAISLFTGFIYSHFIVFKDDK